jgi:small GTP-binding protein
VQYNDGTDWGVVVAIGVEFGSRLVTIPTTLPTLPSPVTPGAAPAPIASSSQDAGKVIKAQMWDTAGQEVFNSLTRSYYRHSSGALLVFSLNSRLSFSHLSSWLRDWREWSGEEGEGVILLVGNKADLCGEGGEREVESDEAREWAEREGLVGYVETSAKIGSGVVEVSLVQSRSLGKH